MNNKEFLSDMSSRTGMTISDVQLLLDTVIAAMGEQFMEGEVVQFTNFGSFEVKKKLERIIVNPSTGQRMLVPPKLVLGFKPSPVWKDKIKERKA